MKKEDDKSDVQVKDLQSSFEGVQVFNGKSVGSRR